MRLRKQRKFAAGIPVDDTIARVISAISPEALSKAFISWVNEYRAQIENKQIANDGKKMAERVRNHWRVENKAHWILDVGQREDESRIRREYAAENVGVMRRLCLNIAKLHPEKRSMKGKLKKAMWSDYFRDELIEGQKLDKV